MTRHELFRDDGEHARSVRVQVHDGAIVVHTHDRGPAVEAAWGDDEYEFWTRVEKEEWGPLAVALIRELLAGRSDATDRLRSLCTEYGVEHTRGSWR
jgi:hypothetical protein